METAKSAVLLIWVNTNAMKRLLTSAIYVLIVGLTNFTTLYARAPRLTITSITGIPTQQGRYHYGHYALHLQLPWSRTPVGEPFRAPSTFWP